MKSISNTFCYRWSSLLLTTLFILCFNTLSFAQRDNDKKLFKEFVPGQTDVIKKNAVSFGLGASFITARLQFEAPTVGWFGFVDDGLKKKSITPAIYFAYDRRFIEQLSIGLSFVYQRVELEQKPNFPSNIAYKYVRMERLNASLKFLWHYHIKSNFSLYSGLRIGINDNKIRTYSNLESWKGSFDMMRGYQFAPQIIGIGIIIPLIDGIEFNAEACIGPPYVLMAGIIGVF